MVAVGNSTYLECLPNSHHAKVTWFKQTGENSLEQYEVQTCLFWEGLSEALVPKLTHPWELFCVSFLNDAVSLWSLDFYIWIQLFVHKIMVLFVNYS